MNTDYLTVEQLAEVLSIGRSSAYELTRQAGFPVVRIGRLKRIPRQKLDGWLQQQLQDTDDK